MEPDSERAGNSLGKLVKRSLERARGSKQEQQVAACYLLLLLFGINRLIGLNASSSGELARRSERFRE